MLAAIDVHYQQNDAQAGLVLFQDWPDSVAHATFSHRVSHCAEYVPGEFYLREMPVILEALAQCQQTIETLLVDCYVDLGDDSPGLGRRLYDRLGGRTRVIGVAKSRFKGSDHATAVFRGNSKRPLFVTAAGIGPDEAAGFVRAMHGEHRVPALVRLADSIARGHPGA